MLRTPIARKLSLMLAVAPLLLATLQAPRSFGAPPAYDLSSRSQAEQTPQTVTLELELGGQLLTPSANEQAEQQRLPVQAKAKLVYDEIQQQSDSSRYVRLYRTVQGETKVAERRNAPELRESRRLIVAHVTADGLQLTGVEGLLSREESQVLEVVGDSLTLNGLLPGKKVMLGDTWQHEAEAMSLLTGVDSIGLCEVSSVLAEANGRFARCQMAGAVHGVMHGASVELEINAIYLVDLRRGCVSQLNLAIREQRAIGPATPGLDAVAKIRVKRSPVGDQSPLTATVVAKATDASPPASQPVVMQSDELGFKTNLDANWYPMGQHGETMTIRRVTPDGLVAHGNFVKLDPKPLDASAALTDFRRDFLLSLGNEAVQLVSEEQWVNQSGHRVMTVVAAGKIADQDIEWRAYQIAPPEQREDLHRLAITFTVERSELGRLGRSDRDLVDRIELLPAEQSLSSRPVTQK